MNSAIHHVGPPSTTRVTWRGGGWMIDLSVANNAITAASIRWDHKTCDLPFLEVLEQTLKSMSLREARDHGVQYACFALLAAGKKTKVSGIVIPANYSETSREAAKALRAAIDAAVPPRPEDWNFDDRGPSDAWRRIPKELRAQELDGIFEESLRQLGAPGCVFVTDIDRYDRVFVRFNREFPTALKPQTLMRLERRARQATGERVELFVSEMKDNNRIRRLQDEGLSVPQ